MRISPGLFCLVVLAAVVLCAAIVISTTACMGAETPTEGQKAQAAEDEPPALDWRPDPRAQALANKQGTRFHLPPPPSPKRSAFERIRDWFASRRAPETAWFYVLFGAAMGAILATIRWHITSNARHLRHLDRRVTKIEGDSPPAVAPGAEGKP